MEQEIKLREQLINEFIEPTYKKVHSFIYKDDLIENSIELYNLGIVINKTLKSYNIDTEELQLLSYDNPFSIRLIINAPITLIDIGFQKDEKNCIYYTVEFVNLEYNIKRKISAKDCETISKYIIGYLSALTLFHEVFSKYKELDSNKYSQE